MWDRPITWRNRVCTWTEDCWVCAWDVPDTCEFASKMAPLLHGGDVLISAEFLESAAVPFTSVDLLWCPSATGTGGGLTEVTWHRRAVSGLLAWSTPSWRGWTRTSAQPINDHICFLTNIDHAGTYRAAAAANHSEHKSIMTKRTIAITNTLCGFVYNNMSHKCEMEILTTFTEKALHLVGCTPAIQHVRLSSIIRSIVTHQLLHSHRWNLNDSFHQR